jgi:glycosyltransferase involved in cell wall biosynthesis
VHHGENGFIFSAGDVNTLTKYLETLVAHPELWKKMGQKSLEIISKWNYDACVEGVLKALEYVTGKRRSCESKTDA